MPLPLLGSVAAGHLTIRFLLFLFLFSGRFTFFWFFPGETQFWTTFWQLFDNFLTTFWHFLTTFWQLFDNFLTTFWQLFDNFFDNFFDIFFDNFCQHFWLFFIVMVVASCRNRYDGTNFISTVPTSLLIAPGLRTIQFLFLLVQSH
jgi:hypothetical protein